jgi:hypothetical protein
MMPLVPLATFLAVQLGGAIWWAARVSTQLDGVREDVKAISEQVKELTKAVQTHETAIAVIETVNRQQLKNGAHRG